MSTVAHYQAAARNAAKKYGLDPRIFVRQINAESGFNPHAGSSAGAQGIAQIMPATARAWGVNPNDPMQALDAAAQHMASYVRKYGSYRKALAAYNAGEGAVQQYNGVPPYAETRNYVSKILSGISNATYPGQKKAAPKAQPQAKSNGASSDTSATSDTAPPLVTQATPNPIQMSTPAVAPIFDTSKYLSGTPDPTGGTVTLAPVPALPKPEEAAAQSLVQAAAETVSSDGSTPTPKTRQKSSDGGGWKTAGASVFSDSQGYKGDNLNRRWKSFAELSKNPSAQDFSAMGNLPYGTKIEVEGPNKRRIVIVKRDIGAGGGRVKTRKGSVGRKIDLTSPVARRLGVNGLAPVRYRIVKRGR
jgi:hypothetical protein